jgi:hypothetical protein
MATTTNYGWTTPDDTSLVKDGASAIRTLGSSIDTSLNNALGTKKAGLVLLNTTSFSAVSSVSLPANTFTTTYDSYLLVLDFTVSQSAELRFRTRLAGTDATGANYDFYANALTQTFDNQSFGTGITSAYICGNDTAITTIMQIHNIALAENTRFSMQGSIGSRNGIFSSGIHNVATAYDSATFFRSAGTMTGQINVLGVNK